MSDHKPYTHIHVKSGGRIAEIVAMRYVYRPGQREIADAMPYSRTTVKKRLFESDEQFRDRVEKQAIEYLRKKRSAWSKEQKWDVR